MINDITEYSDVVNPAEDSQTSIAKEGRKAGTRMYAGVETWNPFKGCEFGCRYCVPSFQQQAKRQKWRCEKCYRFAPHNHPERLGKIPNEETVFVCGNGDIAFCEPEYLLEIIGAIRSHNGRPDTVFYLQTKKPDCLRQVLGSLPKNVVLVTTLETNRDEGYEAISKAPPPSDRYRQFLELEWPRKVVTVEPVMDFDLEEFVAMIVAIRPEYVWLGLNSRHAQVQLPEPSPEKLRAFADALEAHGIAVKGKEFRDLEMPASVERTQG